MRAIRILLRKEFRQIFRNRAMLPIIFVMPMVQLLVLAFAATFEVKETPVSLVLQDTDSASREFVRRFEASGYFRVVETVASAEQADASMQSGRVNMILRIPDGFAERLAGTATSSGGVPVQIILNAQDGATAGVVQAYAAQVVATFNRGQLNNGVDFVRSLESGTGKTERVGESVRAAAFESIATSDVAAPTLSLFAVLGVDIRPRHWYNPQLDYQHFMVPGILVILVTMIGTFLSAMNVVREKELGTMEQLNVTPIRRGELIAGKLIPFWIIALFELAFGLFVAWMVFRIPIEGSLLLVFALASIYLLAMLGLGLWVSTVTETQQQAMFITWFILVVFILMSGLFTPIESMPPWAQWLTELNPIAHFIQIMRRVLLKGAGFGAVATEAAALTAMACVILMMAVRRYRKTTG